ncbi:rhamnan synthesis F family protein [Rhizobium sp. CC-YZS058]|uniref:rhamnan synthesis F family protein n=1 Tax=Rhizobium sp. CC-YZS058 TaxID=3042153 RepID=UPI002B05F53E|nr:rhamnan synthesis F family protein [Rhizobium sp. CC-YZS058]MEA3535646.1 rhamnan synthesis F family protein [Rhizobium sp. CC-YZS058]
MPKVHVYTSFSYAYLSRARILAQSIRRTHPDWVIWAVLVDRPPPGFSETAWQSDFDEILDPEVLFPDWKAFVFKHDIVEACTAVKGRALQHLLASGADKVVYLDPDIAVFHSLQPIIDKLDTASVVLTPHQVDPNESVDDFRDNEQISLKYGIYNLGFIAVKNDPVGNAVADWWATCLYRACYDEIENGIFTDQKYCDLIPCLFDNVYIERKPGFNVASWNISRRHLKIEHDGNVKVNDDLLRFYHFTKINSDGEGMTKRFAAGNYSVFEVWNWYKRQLLALEVPGIPGRYWHYSALDDGTAIPKSVRVFFRQNLAAIQADDPFSVEPGSFAARFRVSGKKRYFNPLRKPSQTKIACVIHAFYPELLDEMLAELSEYRGNLKLFLTVPSDKVGAVKDVLSQYKFEAEILACANRGRDVLPFLTALKKIDPEEFSLVLKLHTKRSKHLQNGEAWRRELLACFTKPQELEAAVKIFDDRPDIGILGPSGHNVSMEGYMGSNEGRLSDLKRRMGVGDIRNAKLGFIAGSIFMARPAALEALLDLDLTEEDFESEAAQTDGTLAHAIERAWTFAASARLLKVATKPISTAQGQLRVDDTIATSYDFAPRSHEIAAE